MGNNVIIDLPLEHCMSWNIYITKYRPHTCIYTRITLLFNQENINLKIMTHISCHFSSLSFTLNYYEDPPSLAYVALRKVY